MTLTASKFIKALGALEMPIEPLEEALKIYQDNPRLQEVLKDPTIYKEQKYAAIDRIFPAQICNLLKLLCEYSDMEYFEEIAEGYRKYVNEHNNKINATLRYVTPPNDHQLEEIKNFLRSKYHVDDVILNMEEDASLIGGFILQAKGEEYDWSLKGRMESLRGQLAGGETNGRS